MTSKKCKIILINSSSNSNKNNSDQVVKIRIMSQIIRNKWDIKRKTNMEMLIVQIWEVLINHFKIVNIIKWWAIQNSQLEILFQDQKIINHIMREPFYLNFLLHQVPDLLIDSTPIYKVKEWKIRISCL